MPDKTLPLILAVLGALAVLAVALFIDVQRASRSGPRWKRRLLTAGLALLAMMGIGPGAAHATDTSGYRLIAAKRDLATTPEWKQIQAVWTEAAAVASGERGSFPFDRAGKDKLLADLDAARKSVEALQTVGQLTDSEALLLISDIDRFKDKVSGFRPTELKGATCYKPMPYRAGRDTFTWLEGRLPLLEKMAASPVRPVVVDKVLARFEGDIAFLSDKTKTHDLTAKQRQQVEELVGRAQRAMRKVRAKLRPAVPPPKPPPPTCYKPMPPPDKRGQAPEALQRRQAAADKVIAAQRLAPTAEAKLLAALATDLPLLPAMLASSEGLESSEEWHRAMRTWAQANEIAQGKKGDYPFDRAGKQAMLDELAKAKKDLQALGEAGKLSSAEAGLLIHALADVVKGVQAKRPTEMRAATCYGPRPYTEGRDALRRLEARLPLVEKLAGAGKVNTKVVAKVIDRIEADVETLASRNASRDLKGDKRTQAASLAKKGKAVLAKLKAKLKPKGPPSRKTCYMPMKMD